MALSYVEYPGNGSTKAFDLTFGYLSRTHVFAFVNNSLVAYKWVSPTRVELVNTPAAGSTIKIARLTDRVTRITTFADGQTLLSGDLNAGDLQNFYILQEIADGVADGVAAGTIVIQNPGTGYITEQWIQQQLQASVGGSEALQQLDDMIAQEVSDRAAAILAEQQARAAAIADEAAARAQVAEDLAAEQAARVAAIAAEAAARAQVAQDLADEEAARAAAVAGEASARAASIAAEASARGAAVLALEQEDLALGQRLDSVEADIDTPTTGLKAKIATLDTFTADLESNKAEASTVTALTATANAIPAGVNALRDTGFHFGAEFYVSEVGGNVSSPVVVDTTLASGLRRRHVTASAAGAWGGSTANFVSLRSFGVNGLKVSPGETVGLRLLVGLNSNTARLDACVEFRTLAGVLISSQTAATLNGSGIGVGTLERESYYEAKGVVTVPAGAEMAYIAIFSYPTAAGTVAIRLAEPVLARLRAGQTEPPLYSGQLESAASRVATAEANITTLQTTTANLETNKAAASTVTAIDAKIEDPTTGLKARATSLESRMTTVETDKASTTVTDAIDAKIETPTTGLKARATSLEGRMTTVETNKAEASTVTSLTARVTTAEGEIDTLQTDVNTAEANITTLQTTTANLETNKAAASTVTAIDAKIEDPTTGLKARATSLEGRMTTVETGKASTTVTDAIDAKIETPTTGLKARATSLEGRMTTVETNKAEASALTSLTSRVTTAEGEIDTLQADVNTAEANITTLQTTTANLETNKAAASTVTAIDAKIEDPTTGLKARATSLESRMSSVETGKASTTVTDAIDAKIETPTTGLKARATSLEGRMTTVETNKAEASTVTTLTATVNGIPAGQNAHVDPGFRFGTTYFTRDNSGNVTSPAHTDETRTSGLRVRVATGSASAAWGSVTSNYLRQRGYGVNGVSVVPGETVGFRVLVAAENAARLDIRIEFRNAAQTFIASGSQVTITSSIPTGTGERSTFTEVTGVAVVPANADMAYLAAVAYPNAAGTITLRMAEPVIARLRAGQTAPPYFSGDDDVGISRLVTAEGNITTLQSTVVDLDNEKAEATTVTALTARVSTGESTGLLRNPRFGAPLVSGVPEGYNHLNGSGALVARIGNSSGYAFRLVGAADTENRVSQSLPVGSVLPGSRYRVQASTSLVSGTYNGAGVWVSFRDASNASLAAHNLGFANNADLAGITSNSQTGLRNWEWELLAPANTAYAIVYAFSHASYINGGFTVANSIDWHLLDFVPTNSRLSSAESNITSLQTTTSNLQTGKAEATALTALTSRVTTAEADIDAIEGVNSTQNGRLTTAESNITTLQSTVVDLDNEKAEASTVTTLQTQANSLQTAAANELPSSFDLDGQFWTSAATGSPASAAAPWGGSYRTISGVGRVRAFAGFQTLCPRGVIPAIPNSVWEVEVRARVTINSTVTGGSKEEAVAHWWQALNADYTAHSFVAATAVAGSQATRTPFRVADGWQTFRVRYTVPASPAFAFIRPRWYVGYDAGGNGDAEVETLYILIRRVTQEVALESSITSLQTTTTNLQTGKADATAVTALTARVASGDATGLLRNSRFSEVPVGGVPPGWTSWSGTTSGTAVARWIHSGGNALRLPGQAGTNAGYQAASFPANTVRAGSRLRVLIEAVLVSGTYDGSGVYIDWRTSGGVALTPVTISLSNTADTSGTTSNSTAGFRAWDVEVVAPATAAYANVYFMSHWNLHSGGSAVANSIDWHLVDLVPVSGRLTTAEANITTLQSTTVDLQNNKAEATALTSLTARVQANETDSGLVNNPKFAATWAGTQVPTGWTSFDNGAGLSVSRVGAPGYAYRLTGGAGANAANRQIIAIGSFQPNSKYLVRVTARRNSGDFTGSGVYFDWYNSSDVFISRTTITLATTKASNGVTSATHDGVTTWEVQVTTPANASKCDLVFGSHLAAWGSIAAANAIDWYCVDIVPSGYSEANVDFLKTALATGSASQATLMFQVNTGTNAAILRAYAGEGDGVWNGSAISLDATYITLNGNVVVNGTLTAPKIANNELTKSAVDSNTTGITCSTTYQDVAELTLNVVSSASLVRIDWSMAVFGSSSEAGDNQLLVRVLRDGVDITGDIEMAAITATSAYTLYSGGNAVIGDEVKVPNSVRGMFAYVMADVGASAGNRVYKLQAKRANTNGTWTIGRNIMFATCHAR